MNALFNDDGRPSKGRKRLEDRYAKAHADYERISAELARTQNRWQKARAQLAAMGKRLDKQFCERADA